MPKIWENRSTTEFFVVLMFFGKEKFLTGAGWCIASVSQLYNCALSANEWQRSWERASHKMQGGGHRIARECKGVEE